MRASVSKYSHRWVWALAVAACVGANLGAPRLNAQQASGAPAQGGAPNGQPTPGMPAQGAKALGELDNFMQSHPDVAKEVQANPSLLSNSQYLSQHTELQTFMSSHPNVAKLAQTNPQRLMSVEQQFRRGGAGNGPGAQGMQPGQAKALDGFNNFMQSHPDVAKEVQANPSLLSNSQYLSQHPELQTFMSSHPNLAKAAQTNPQRLMSVDQQFRQSGAGNGPGAPGMQQGRAQALDGFNNFMQGHPDVAKEVQANPSLLSNSQYLSQHPELQTYMNNHPDVAKAAQSNPQRLMSVDQQFRQSGMAVDQTQVKSYDEFMHNHPEVTEQLQKDPSLANNPEFIKNHPEYEQYLKDHPGIRTDLQQHPEHFMNRAATYNENHPAEPTAAKPKSSQGQKPQGGTKPKNQP